MPAGSTSAISVVVVPSVRTTTRRLSAVRVAITAISPSSLSARLLSNFEYGEVGSVAVFASTRTEVPSASKIRISTLVVRSSEVATLAAICPASLNDGV